jgi:protein TonB
MKRKNKMVPGFDEIIFENRNKEYGAYDLRKHYNSTECYSILGGIAIFTSLVIGLAFAVENDGSANIDQRMVVVKIDPINPRLLKVEEPEMPVMKPVMNAMLAPEVITDTSRDATTMISTEVLIRTVQNRNVGDTNIVITDPTAIAPLDPEPAISVEEMPTFPGGNEALLKLISETIKYPAEAANNGIQGRVTLRFVVSADGSVKNVEVIRGVHPSIDQEAVRIVSTLPKWKPGKQNGQPVPVWFFVPVTFRLKYN